MTDIPSPTTVPSVQAELRPELLKWYEAWRGCLQSVLAQVSGQPSVFEISPQPLAGTASDIWYTVVAGGALHGEMVLHLTADSGTRLAQKFLGEAGPATPEAPGEPTAATEITSDNKEALEEFLRQIAGLAATATGATAGGEVKLSVAAAAAPPSWKSDAVVCLQTRSEAGTSIAVELQVSPALAAELQPRVPPTSPPMQTTATSAPGPSVLSSPSADGYRRLMDVGLDVKLRFGSRRMLLRDVLALSAGVVVELDNALHSPVDLLLDGRLIAQGDVVIVDGKYGLRITDVVESAPSVSAAT
ncbi:MAG: flagellar motor switch protein FliN [Terriglobales bacterium]